MKESEFITLLNLYVDHEITPADAARLEAEVQANPARRRTYRQYCQMSKACTMLAKDFADEAPAPQADNVIALAPASRFGFGWGPGAFAATGLAVAAACVALVFVNRATTSSSSSTGLGGGGTMAVAETPATAPVANAADTGTLKPAVQNAALVAVSAPEPKVQVSAPEMASKARTIGQTVTIPGLRLASAQNAIPTPALTLTALNQQQETNQALANLNAQLDWMQKVQLAPVETAPAEQLRLNAINVKAIPSTASYDRSQLQGTVQRSAFEFQK